MTTPAGQSPRYAWYGRVSTEDEQDPTLSFPRQLANTEHQVEEAGGRIVAHFYDIESGTRAYTARGSGGLAGFDIPIPRDGGLQDLLTDAARRPAPFDRVIVESISRLSRNSSVAFRVEDELRAIGVRLCAADEPLEESFGTIVLRHVNIGIARGYHHELMVKSRQGQETSTRQGWHTGGVALFGYRFVTHDHPNPHKASRGINKRTLELDPVRAPVVRAMYDWYLGGGMDLLQIRDRLNADPERYPPPVPIDPTTARGAWSRSSVWEVLRNPKYTGYQVWNRRARKKGHNRTNPTDAWIWSEEPAHPAIVSREEYDALQARAKANMRSRQGVPATVARPRARNEYFYRGLLRCGICGLRMWGNRKRDVIYYSCQPSHQRAKNIPAGHPSHLYLNEQRLNDSLIPFLATSLISAHRIDYWRLCLEVAAEPEHCTPATERAKEIEAEIAELERRLERQLLNLEADDVTSALRRHIARRVDELEAAIGARREQLDATDPGSPTEAPRLADVAPLLDRLPILADRLDSVPQAKLRPLFDAMQLDVVYQPADSAVDISLTLYDGGDSWRIDAAGAASEDWLAPPAGLEPATHGLGKRSAPFHRLPPLTDSCLDQHLRSHRLSAVAGICRRLLPKKLPKPLSMPVQGPRRALSLKLRHLMFGSRAGEVAPEPRSVSSVDLALVIQRLLKNGCSGSAATRDGTFEKRLLGVPTSINREIYSEKSHVHAIEVKSLAFAHSRLCSCEGAGSRFAYGGAIAAACSTS